MASLERNSSSRFGAMPYPERFRSAAAYVGFSSTQLSPVTSMSDDTNLLLYALYMQATVGPCYVQKPWSWTNPTEYAKWTSWHQLASMPTVEAMRLFVRTLEMEDPDWLNKFQERTIEITEEPTQENDMRPKFQEEELPVSNNSPPSPPPVSTNGGLMSEEILLKMEDESIECSAVLNISEQNKWVSPSVSGRRPAARYQHAAAVAHGKLFLIGGNHNGRYLNDVQVLDLRTLTWSKIEQNLPPILAPCAGHSLIRHNRMLFVVGGHSKSSSETVTVHALDTETFTWSCLPTYGQAPIARGGQSVSLVGTTIVMFGGEDTKRRLLNDLNIFDLGTMTWDAVDAVGIPPSPRSDHAAAVYNDRYLYVFGGGSHSTCFNDLHVLDMDTMEWSQPAHKGTPPAPRAGHAGTTIADKWYIVGGGDNKSGVSETMALDMSTVEWSTVTTVPARTYIACEGLSLVSASLNGEETLIAFGGYNGRYSNEIHMLRTGIMGKSKSKDSSASESKSSTSSSSSSSCCGGRFEVCENPVTEIQQVDSNISENSDMLWLQAGNVRLKKELRAAVSRASELAKELQGVRGQLVVEQSRCFKLEVDVAEVRNKLQTMEAMQKDLDILRSEKRAWESGGGGGGDNEKQSGGGDEGGGGGGGGWSWWSVKPAT